MLLLRHETSGLILQNRVLLACIKHLGAHPCPRCCIKKAQIREIGSKPDMARRVRLQRVDNAACRRKIEEARKLIFEKGLSMKSESVLFYLDPESLVPTKV